ncbi:MAG: hypothetical protein ACTSP1_10045 [Candidatus Freyarchaeota archaeon]
MRLWRDARLDRTAKGCLNDLQSYLDEKGIRTKISLRYRLRVADRGYFQGYFERAGYSQHFAERLAEMTKALTMHGESLIAVQEEYIEDYATVLHELLHSLTWMKTRYKRWVREGLTRCVQKMVANRFNKKIGKSYYDELSYTKLWEEIATSVGEKTVLHLYFSKTKKEALKKTEKNFQRAGLNLQELLEMDYSQAKILTRKKG